MRYFWSLILVVALVTAGLFTLRVTRERAEITPVSASSTPASGMGESGFGQRPTRPVGTTAPVAPPPAATEPATASVPIEEDAPESGLTTAVGSDVLAGLPSAAIEPEQPLAVAPTQPASQAPASSFSLDELLGVVAEAAEHIGATNTPTPAPALAETAPAAPAMDPMMEAALAANTPAAEAAVPVAAVAPAPSPAAVGPAFEVRADGSLLVEGVGVVPGNGTAQRPFVLDWEVLRSVQRDFNPRQGQSEVPAWLRAMDGKRVRVEGNTLLPVVSQTTTELLVMQNPWDGCCLGVPPTPYDAIEVKLAKAQRMGNSPTGFGQVEGVFKVDPYIVSGWLLGLFMVEDAAFESAAGIVLPEI